MILNDVLKNMLTPKLCGADVRCSAGADPWGNPTRNNPSETFTLSQEKHLSWRTAMLSSAFFAHFSS